MRILIFTHPRAGSTYVQNLLAYKFSLENWGELQGPEDLRGKGRLPEYEYYTRNNYVVKVLSVQLFHNIYDWSNFNWTMMDHIVITDRSTNLTDQICSWMTRVQGITSPSNLDTTSLAFTHSLKCLKRYYEHKQYLVDNFQQVKVVPYELTQKLPEDYVDELNRITNFDISVDDCYSASDCKGMLNNKKDYRKLVLNYDEVTEIIKDTI